MERQGYSPSPTPKPQVPLSQPQKPKRVFASDPKDVFGSDPGTCWPIGVKPIDRFCEVADNGLVGLVTVQVPEASLGAWISAMNLDWDSETMLSSPESDYSK